MKPDGFFATAVPVSAENPAGTHGTWTICLEMAPVSYRCIDEISGLESCEGDSAVSRRGEKPVAGAVIERKRTRFFEAVIKEIH